jgi:hypothetical protein
MEDIFQLVTQFENNTITFLYNVLGGGKPGISLPPVFWEIEN